MHELHNLDRTELAKHNCSDTEEIAPECKVSNRRHGFNRGDPPLRCAPWQIRPR